VSRSSINRNKGHRISGLVIRKKKDFLMKMTETERRVFEAWAVEMPGIKIETHHEFIRERMKQVAFHETGHAAANTFLGVIGSAHFEGLSIVPDHGSLGRVTHSRVTPFVVFGDKPTRCDHVKGKKTMIFHLAGRVAESRINDDMISLEDAVIDGWEDVGSEEEWRQKVDEGKALDIAEALSNKTWPPFRILLMMEKWTNELMDIPEVWGVVQALAEQLIKKGEILDYEVFRKMTKPIDFKWTEYPVWERRFSVDLKRDL